MFIQITVGRPTQGAALGPTHLASWVSGSRTGRAFDFNKNQKVVLLGYQVNFVRMGTPILIPDAPSTAQQICFGMGFPQGPQGLIFVLTFENRHTPCKMSQSLPRINPTETFAWKQLMHQAQILKGQPIRDFLEKDSDRAKRMSAEGGGWYLDYSKNALDQKTLELLFQLLEECGWKQALEATRSGARINETENRAVLHTILRDPAHPLVMEDGVQPGQLVQAVLDRMEIFVNGIREGKLRGCTGKKFTDVVNLGIGGSDLGPLMACEALAPYAGPLKVHFVSNVDGAHWQRTLNGLNPETTLFLVASKTFTTQETMANAQSARNWFISALGDQADVGLHFVALSTNLTKVKEFGIGEDRMFPFWDWVGGRYSVWSAIGMSLALSIGFDRFREFLEGGRQMDHHFWESEPAHNLPVLLAMVGLWNRNFLGYDSLAILPYDQCLSRFPAYLQQADMESNGKSVDRNGQPLTYGSGPVLWGEPGTNGQHAFYQLLHQGTTKVPCDFILAANSHYPGGPHHRYLSANALAQAQALMRGRTLEEVRAVSPAENRAEAFQVFEGNRPSNFLMCPRLTPSALGALVAMYEHKIWVQGLVWNVFSYDQWGVELGKILANRVLPWLDHGVQEDEVSDVDCSTYALIQRWRQWQEGQESPKVGVPSKEA